jgi:hypothetical protein
MASGRLVARSVSRYSAIEIAIPGTKPRTASSAACSSTHAASRRFAYPIAFRVAYSTRCSETSANRIW